MQLHAPLILASRSPRRRKLLDRLGFTFTIEPSPAEEIIPPDASPAEAVRAIARDKADLIAARYSEALTLAADTIVAFDGAILEKPIDTEAARAMLARLSGQTHTVYTGIALVHPASDRSAMATEATDVTFGTLSTAEIDAYVATGSPMDKAGSYGIQDDMGALFVDRIEGDYYNVVGLPLRRLYLTLRDQFGDLLTL